MKCDDCDDGWLRDIKADGWIQCPKCRGTMWLGPHQADLDAVIRRDETLVRLAGNQGNIVKRKQPDDPGVNNDNPFKSEVKMKPLRYIAEPIIVIIGAIIVATAILIAVSSLAFAGPNMTGLAAGFAGQKMSGASSWSNALGSYRLSQLYTRTQSASGRARLNRNGFGPYSGDIKQYDVPKGYNHVTYGPGYTKFSYPKRAGAPSLSIQAINLGGCGRTCSE